MNTDFHQQANIEQYKIFTQQLIKMWCDTFEYSDKEIKQYIVTSMMAFLDRIPAVINVRNIDNFKKHNEAIEELEYLIEFLETNCRHNNYGVLKND